MRSARSPTAGHFSTAGADIIDVGGELTRPGADELPPGEEIRRVEPVVRALVNPAPSSRSIPGTKPSWRPRSMPGRGSSTTCRR